jgi:hypothetical protein
MTNQTTSHLICEEIYSDVLIWIDLFVSSLVPFFLMILSTSILLKSIFESRRKLKTKATKINLKPIKSVPTTSSINKIQLDKQKTQNRDIKFAITSISLNILFLVTNIPITAYGIYGTYVTVDGEIDELINVIFLFIYYTSFGSIFYISLFVNSIFKEEFLILFFRRRIQKSTSSQLSSI